MIFFRIFILFFLFISSNPLLGSLNRDIWRYHYNLKDIKNLFYYENKLYCFASKGFFYLDLESRNIIKNSVDLNLSGVDIIRSDSGPKIIEVNSSPGLQGIQGITKVDLASKIIQYIEMYSGYVKT